MEDRDELVMELGAIGAKIITPPEATPWGRRAVVKDFDGHTVELTA
jgi:lactoylglutathione lyase